MLSFIKKLFGFGPAPVAEEAPYKVEAPVVPVVVAAADVPVVLEEAPVAPAKPKKAKKPAAITAKPRAKKAKAK